MEVQGKKILNNNPFFTSLCSLMKNVEFREFYNTYFNDWSEIQCMIFYMKLYESIQIEYESRYNSKISDETMSFMLHEIMTTSEARKIAFDMFRNYKELDVSKSDSFKAMLTF